MRTVLFTAALAAILAITTAACGGEDGDAGEDKLHPTLSDATYLQIQEEREYVTITVYHTSPHMSDTINAIHQGGYELQHISSNDAGRKLLVFRKIADPEESPSSTGTTPTNSTDTPTTF